MESLVISSVTTVECGLHFAQSSCSIDEHAAAIGMPDGRIFIALKAVEDITIIQDFDASPQRTDAGLISMKYVPRFNFLLTHTRDGEMWTHLRDPGSNLFFPGLPVAKHVSAGDVVVAGAQCLVCALSLEMKNVTLIHLTRTTAEVIGEFPLPKECDGDVVSISWVSPSIVALAKRGSLIAVAVDGTPVFSHDSTVGVPIGVPLGHSFSRDDRNDLSKYSEGFAVIYEVDWCFFRFRAAVFSVAGEGIIRLVRTIVLLCESRPHFVTWWGPWIVVGGSEGIEFYEIESGQFSQSAIEDVSITAMDLQNQVVDDRSANASWFSSPHTSLCITEDGKVCSVKFLSVKEIIGNLVRRNTIFQMDIIERLMQFGHSVGASNLFPSEVSIDVEPRSYVFSAYGRLVSRCAFSATDGEDDVSGGGSPTSSGALRQDITNSSPTRSGRGNCLCCQKPLSLLGTKRCSVCRDKVCSTCFIKTNGMLLGLERVVESGSDSVILCLNCDGSADQNLRRLLLARRYHQVIRYVRRYPQRCAKFPLDEVLPLCIEQCFYEDKFEWCARLVCKYVESSTIWDTWIMNFALTSKLGLLVDLMPNNAAEFARTTILLQLIRLDPAKLHSTLRKWRPGTYDGKVIAAGIVAKLKSNVREAMGAYLSCQTERSQNVVDVNAADTSIDPNGVIYSWYHTRQTEQLILSLIRTVMKGEGEDKDRAPFAASVYYLEHYLQWIPVGDWFPDTRRRSSSVFQDRPPKRFPAIRSSDLMDFWDHFVSNNLFPEFIRSRPLASENMRPLLLPLLKHYGADLCKHVLAYDPSKCAEYVDLIVEQLKECTVPRYEFLHQLTSISPSTTARYHQQLAEMYLELAPKLLLPFVRNRQVDSLDWLKLAAQVEQRRMFPELVYIIGRTGNDKEAVRIALRCLGDVALAIQYVVDSEDTSLWEEAISHVIQSQELIGQFLEVAGDRYDPSLFLRRIPNENRLKIKNVGPRLRKLVVDRKSSLGIAESYKGTVEDEGLANLQQFRRHALRAVKITTYPMCMLCKEQCIGDRQMVIGLRGPMHAECFEEIFCRSDSYALKHCVTKDMLFDIGLFDARRRCGVTDLVELLNHGVLSHIASWLGPYSRICCEMVSVKWRRQFLSIRKTATGSSGNPMAVFLHNQRTKVTPSIQNTINTVGLTRFGEYRLLDTE